MDSCPDENTLQAFLDGRLDLPRARAFRGHVAGCIVCHDLLSLVDDEVPALSETLEAPEVSRSGPAADPPQAGPGSLTFAPGEVVADRYCIQRFIARGGMGQVYAATDLVLGIDVALKTLLPHIAGDEHAFSRFKREVLLARQVTHENVCRIFDLGIHQRTEPGGPHTVHFLTMELLLGRTLAQRLREHGPLAPSAALPLIRQMLHALAAAHQHGIVHRDFKPDNIFLVPAAEGRERVVVTDFGLARASLTTQEESEHTPAGVLVGTPAYMAPEQLLGEEVGPAADIYSFGVVLYEMVTGTRPFSGVTPRATAFKRLVEAPPSPRERRPDLDPSWEATILRCLEKNPEARYGSVREVLSGIAALDSEVGALHPTPDGRAVRRPRRPGGLLIGLGVVALGLTIGAGVLWLKRMTPPGGMARIPGGTFLMGSTADEIEAAYLYCRPDAGDLCKRDTYDREQPQRQVEISTFWLDRTEVPNQDFAAWLNRRPGVEFRDGRRVYEGAVLLADLYPGYRPTHGLIWQGGHYRNAPGFEHDPVTQVTGYGASRYCQDQGKRLPTEAEWEYAARGRSGGRFPWGFDEPRCDGVLIARRPGQSCAYLGLRLRPVGSSAQDKSPDGVFDLAGSVSEWVQDRFVDRYPACPPPCRDPLVDAASGDPGLRVVRGGGWHLPASACRSAGRSRWRESEALINVGFRCASSQAPR